MRKETASFLSFVGTFTLVAYIGFAYAPVGAVWDELMTFLSGGALEIERVEESLLVILPVAFLIIFFDLVISLPISVIVNAPFRKKSAKKLTLEQFFDAPRADEEPGRIVTFVKRKLRKLPFKSLQKINEAPGEKPIFKMLFWVILFEELFARALFLGLLTKVFTGTTAFYVLLLLGNGLWALVHLTNYKPGNRHPIRVLTQFLGGFLHSYIFVKYGFMMCFFTHFAYNASLFAFTKRRDVDWDNVISMVTSVLAAFAALMLMSKSLSSASPWLEPHINFHLEGWDVWDYALLSVFATYALKSVMDILLYDRRKNDTETLDEVRGTSLLAILFFGGIIIAITPLVIGLVYWIGGIFFDDTPSRVLFTCLPFALANTSTSLSAAMRVFWVILPNLYIFVCITQSAGYLAASLVMCVEMAFIIPIFFAGKLFKHA